ncbi:uncharacterized protein LOC131291362 [Anopheles ziemanni]|uniref:uncharacterized protein LOC131267577 n=1 Tax=Anopheles coustani TaxID=139045 RepID=UPI0026584826|nr:uncharacterized protein LOC131267577 [Anopheles coustani]XP_058126467.1 uncharacterized protein LOC131267577 [Anopheles coustani]XP_058176548.1 uncharacterized protein LOC131291362 [Anopheles ziemanni]
MRTKPFLVILTCVLMTTFLLILFGSAGQQNDSLKNIVSQTHQHLRNFKQNLRESNSDRRPEIDPKYLAQLGFTQPLYNGTRANFTVVTYALPGELASTLLFVQSMAFKLPTQPLLVYDLGLEESDLHTLQTFCNGSSSGAPHCCAVITYDLNKLPAHVADRSMHAFRPVIIHDALARSKMILFTENNVRLKGSNPARDIEDVRLRAENSSSGVLGCATKQPVTSRTHPKMFEYFETGVDNFYFLPMTSLEFVFFRNSATVNEKVLLPWVRCALTLECLHPIGAQSGGCKYNKKPLYRYSGCHAYDTCAFNIILGMTFGYDESNYSNQDLANLYYLETLEQATKILENRRKNISDTSEHPFTED